MTDQERRLEAALSTMGLTLRTTRAAGIRDNLVYWRILHLTHNRHDYPYVCPACIAQEALRFSTTIKWRRG